MAEEANKRRSKQQLPIAVDIFSAVLMSFRSYKHINTAFFWCSASIFLFIYVIYALTLVILLFCLDMASCKANLCVTQYF